MNLFCHGMMEEDITELTGCTAKKYVAEPFYFNFEISWEVVHKGNTEYLSVQLMLLT